MRVYYTFLKSIVLFQIQLVFALVTANAQNNPVTISGRVVDEKNIPLQGVSVQVKGGKVVAITDQNGSFSATADKEAILQFTHEGYGSYERPVGNGMFQVALTAESKSLEQVVVIGYGTQKKRAVTGAVVSVGYDEFKDRSFSNVAQSLAGTVPGVNITSSQGAPGFGPTIKIRGTSSVTAGTTPLYVVDGMALENFDLNQINPQDIQSVEILKDAASSAIYGSRGANGVVIVTTKLGKAGKTQVNVTYEQGISKVTRKVDMMDAQEWIKYYVDARNNAWVLLDPVNNKPTDDNAKRSLVSGAKNYLIPEDFLTNPGQFGKGTDWQDVMFRTAPMSNAQVSLSGGTDKTNYLFSVGYLDQKAVLIENFYKRLSLRTNIRQKISDKVTTGLNIAFTGSNDRTDGTTGKSDAISLGLQSDPIFPEYNENGNIGFLDPNSTWKRFQTFGVQLWNPHSLISYADKLNKTYNTLGNAYLEVKPIKDLTLRASGNGNLTNTNYNWYWEAGQGYGYSSVLPAQASVRTTSNLNWQSEFTATYNKSFGEHTLGIVAGYSTQKNKFDVTGINGTDFPNDLVRTINAAGTVTKPANSNFSEEWSLLSMLGRVSYGFKNKYFINTTLRRDGSSRFGPDSKWGIFPSVSGAWVVSDENFMRNITAINTLKLRVSYGQTGNNLIPNYGSISLLSTSRYVNGTSVVNGLRTSTISNPELKWEKTGQFNIGADLALFRNRLNVTLDAYRSVTKDMLLNVPVPAYTGFTTQLTNIGSMENKGFEFGLSSKNITGSAFTWSTDFNLSLNRNKVLKLGPNNAPIEIDEWGYFVTEVGQPISNYKGYIFDGIYNNQGEIDKSVSYPGAAPGDPIIRDINGDKKININDRTILGNIQPDFTAGLTNTFQFKGFEFSFMLQGIFGSEIWNQQTRFSKFWNDSRNSYASVTNYWKSEQDPGDGKTFKPYATYSANAKGKAAFIQGYSNYWMEDGSFVRIKNLRIAYALPQTILKKSPAKNIRVYANAENVYVFSDYVGYDPENSTYSVGTSSVPGANGGSATNPPGLLLGADYGAYPIPLILTFGVKMDF